MSMGKGIYVAGKFDDNGGRPSKIGRIIFQSMDSDFDYLNGGYFKELKKVFKYMGDYETVYWFADVPNNKTKLVQDIKKINKKCTLVTSKRNTENKYKFQDLIYHSLGIKSNLVLEFTEKDKKYEGRIMDPLGNVFLDHTKDFEKVGHVLDKRVNELSTYTRVGSGSIGKKIEAPDEKEFFKTVRNYAEKFHELIHAHPDAANRFFGNASFRCESGFPSFKKDELVFVSRRNIDKRKIDSDSFVAVKSGNPVEYFGEQKPSVDTPIQMKLYEHYPHVKYMLHSHTYIKDAEFTRKVVPCGAIEEADEIIELYPNENSIDFAVNLRGHGSIVLAEDVGFMKNTPYISRPTPELHDF